MAYHQRLVWYEGMTLDPHHFQQWDRYLRGLLNFRVQSVLTFDWGLIALDIDKESLANGQLILKSCRGFMRDGLAFDIPGNDRAPQPRTIEEHFPPTDEKLSAHLAIPLERPGGMNCSLDGSIGTRQVRFVLDNLSVADDNTGANERQIGIGRPNFLVLFGNEPLDEFSTLHIADVVRASDSTYTLSKKFVPPSLSIAASETLMNIIRRLLEILVAKSKTLTERRTHQPSGQVDFSTSDVTILGVLQSINSIIPQLSHHYNVTKCHPEVTYSILASLAGQLTTFSPESDLRPSDIPVYDHGNSWDCFNALDVRISELLEAAISTNFIAIRLEKKSENRWMGSVSDAGLLGTSQFFLTASGDVPERKVIDELPHKIKIGGPNDIDTLFAAALPGLQIIYAARAPVGLPSRPGLQYFRLEKVGPLWDSIRKSSAVAIFIPAEFRGIKLQLIAVKEA